MAPSEDISKEAITDLEKRAAALEASTRRETTEHGHQAAGEGYRLMAVMLGGVLMGLALGLVIDGVAHTAPFGIIGGVLTGFGVSVYTAVRLARQISATAEERWGPPQDLPPEDEDDEL
jgi:ATP synthase protein I